MSKSQSLGLTKDSHPWEYPDCPECGRHIYVEKAKNSEFDFRCHKCGCFDKPALFQLREELR